MTDWQAVVAEHGPKVWRTTFRILVDHADALDCYQETFLAVCRSPRRRPVLDSKTGEPGAQAKMGGDGQTKKEIDVKE